MDSCGNPILKKAHSIASQLREDGFLPYCQRGMLLVAALMIVSLLAPKLPIAFIAIAVVAYALIATCGQLYDVVIRRKHKQFKLEEEGKISRINRRWVVSLIVCLITSSVSGVLFVLEAPRWDLLEWFLLWVAIPCFFGIYEIARNRLSKEFKPWALKATSLRWSFMALTILLCIAYAAIGINGWNEYRTLEAAFQGVTDPFQNAASALFSELSYVATFTDGLTNYGLSAIADEDNLGAAAIFVARFISYALIILGLASQYCACLLNKKEIKSEFCLLPDPDNEHGSTGYVKRYFVFAGTIVILFFSLMCLGEDLTLKAMNTKGYSVIKTCVDSEKHELILRIDERKTLAEEETTNAEKEARIGNTIDQALQAQREATNVYYDACIQASDSYVDWYYDDFNSPINVILRLFAPLLAGDAFEKFKEIVGQSEQLTAAEKSYQIAQDSIRSLLGNPEFLDEPIPLDLFKGIDNENKFAENYLIPRDGETREEFQNRLRGLFDEQRKSALNQIENISASLDLN